MKISITKQFIKPSDFKQKLPISIFNDKIQDTIKKYDHSEKFVEVSSSLNYVFIYLKDVRIDILLDRI